MCQAGLGISSLTFLSLPLMRHIAAISMVWLYAELGRQRLGRNSGSIKIIFSDLKRVKETKSNGGSGEKSLYLGGDCIFGGSNRKLSHDRI